MCDCSILSIDGTFIPDKTKTLNKKGEVMHGASPRCKHCKRLVSNKQLKALNMGTTFKIQSR